MLDAARSAFQRRYGSASTAPVEGPWNAVIEQLLAHRSVRAYRSDPLPAGTLEVLVAAAQSASSSSNLQVFSVIAVEDAARRARLSVLARDQAHVREAPLLLAFVADLSRIDDLARQQGRDAQGLDYLEALLLGAIDAAIAAQNAAVALESLGLGCCYIGGLRNRPLEVAEELGLPERSIVMFGLCVGYEDPARPAHVKPRLPQATVLHRERYDREAAAAARTGYDATLSAFQAAEKMRPAAWSRQAVDRLATPAALHGREALVEVLQQRGFRLR